MNPFFTLAAICTLSLVSPCLAQRPNQWLYTEHFRSEVIRNQVTKHLEYRYKLKKQVPTQDSTLNYSFFFAYDNLGRLATLTVVPKETAEAEQYSYSYDVTGKLAKEIHQYSRSSSIRSLGLDAYVTKQYEYDSYGNEVLVYEYNFDTTRLKVNQKLYDENKRVIAVQRALNNGQAFVATQYFYDANDQVIKIQEFDDRGSLSYTELYVYDSQRNTRMLYVLNGRGRNLSDTWVFNSAGQCIEHIIHDELSQTNIYYKYNPDGTLFEERHMRNDRLIDLFRHYYWK